MLRSHLALYRLASSSISILSVPGNKISCSRSRYDDYGDKGGDGQRRRFGENRFDGVSGYRGSNRGGGGFRRGFDGNGQSNGYGGIGRGGGYGGGFRGGRGGGSSGSGGSRWEFQEKLPKVNFNEANLQPLTKNLYHEHASVTQRSQAEVNQWVAANNVTLNGNDIPRPVVEFIEGSFPEPIENLLHSHYQKPTVIQSISWPVALSGRDLVAIAQTGSGKTLGFILPAIIHTLNQPKRAYGEGPSVVVLLPTRELAQQVENVARDYCQAMQLSLVCCYGGASKEPQARELRRGVDVVVATPGRLYDFLQTNMTTMNRCSYLVLDEADRMLDMGFEPQIRNIVSQIRPDRQTTMFSATWPKDVRSLADTFLIDPVFLNVGSLELTANPDITQLIEVLDERDKATRIVSLIKSIRSTETADVKAKILIFCSMKKTAEGLMYTLRNSGLTSALSIHGDKSQSERDFVMNEFRRGGCRMMVATDVAARGIDVVDISHVINYDMPKNIEDYVHRIGRTARAGRKGIAISFFTAADGYLTKELVKQLKDTNQEVPKQLLRSGQFYSPGFIEERRTVR